MIDFAYDKFDIRLIIINFIGFVVIVFFWINRRSKQHNVTNSLLVCNSMVY